MVAKKAFRRFVQQPAIQGIAKELRERGQKEDDIRSAIGLAFWLERLDSKVFPGKALEIRFCRGQSRNGATASYHHREKFYRIFVPGLCRKMRGYWQLALVYITKNGNISYPVSRINKRKLITLEEVMCFVAAHEVRHRRQRMPNFTGFNARYPRLEGTTWDIYRKLVRKRRVTEKDMLALELSVQRDIKKESKEKMPMRELDAKVIENLVLDLAHIGRSIARVIAAIKLQPQTAAISI